MAEDNTQTLNVLVHVLGIFTSWLGPLIIYLVGTEPSTKEHAKNALNWQISLLIYFFVSFILMFVLIGFLLIFILWILDLIFCIKGALKAKDGEMYTYPLTIRFLK